MKKSLSIALLTMFLALFNLNAAQAIEDSNISTGKVSWKTTGAAALSLLIWPGIGQAVNDAPGKKVASHAIIGLLPPYRFWSAYDALVDRKGGYWEGRI